LHYWESNMPNFGLDKLGATSLTTTVNRVLNDATVATGLNATKALQGQLTNAQTALGSLGNQLAGLAGQSLGQLPGLLANIVPPQLKINLGNISQTDEIKKTKNTLTGVPPFPNILGKFASYSYLFTLSCLDDDSLNFPESTYRAGRFNTLILASGSINPENRIETAFGKFDFFMDNVSINHLCAFSKDSGNSNIMGVSFKITEPYSMGLFPQALQKAAVEAGHPSYLGSAPFLLTIDFTGHTEDNLAVSLPKERRLYVLTLADMSARVTQKGTEYEITANPYTQQAFNRSYHTILTDTTISGETVQEMLQTGEKSLQKAINDFLQEKAKERNEVPDEVVILFPEDPSSPYQSADLDINKATRNPKGGGDGGDIYSKLKLKQGQNQLNKTFVQDTGAVNSVGKASMGFSAARAGDSPFGKDNAVYDEDKGVYIRGNLAVNVTTSDFKFLQDTDISNVINQVVIMSDYAKQALRDGQVDDSGMIPWWRIDPQIYQLDSLKNMGKTGKKPALIVYRVIAYKVSPHIILPPNSVPKGLDVLKKEAIKEYNYIYTGKNTEIIDFNITLNNSFRLAVTADDYKSNEDVKQQKQTGQDAGEDTPQRQTTQDVGATAPENALPRQVSRTVLKQRTDGKGGGGKEDLSTRLARNFMDAVTIGSDMLELDLKINGDPYYLGDSGVGNYTSPETNYRMVNSDGSMNYQNTEVYININFRTPTDWDINTGLYKNITDGGTLVQAYSGLYKIRKVSSSFAQAKFTQTLDLIRINNQELLGKVPTHAFPINQDAGDPVNSDLENEIDLEGAGPGFTDEEIAQNNAELGDWNG